MPSPVNVAQHSRSKLVRDDRSSAREQCDSQGVNLWIVTPSHELPSVCSDHDELFPLLSNDYSDLATTHTARITPSVWRRRWCCLRYSASGRKNCPDRLLTNSALSHARSGVIGEDNRWFFHDIYAGVQKQRSAGAWLRRAFTLAAGSSSGPIDCQRTWPFRRHRATLCSLCQFLADLTPR